MKQLIMSNDAIEDIAKILGLDLDKEPLKKLIITLEQDEPVLIEKLAYVKGNNKCR